jgi:hypothetical protein
MFMGNSSIGGQDAALRVLTAPLRVCMEFSGHGRKATRHAAFLKWLKKSAAK